MHENYYSTSEIAKKVGVHPNTIRLYEELGWISVAQRKPNGYRIFTDLHIAQFQMARVAFHVELLQNGLRKQVRQIIIASAKGDLEEAFHLTSSYLAQVEWERCHAEEAIQIAEEILSSPKKKFNKEQYTRKEAVKKLKITVDTLRNWERNGLLTVKRTQNGHVTYSADDISRLKMIRALRCANYSLAAILRMLQTLSHNPQANIRTIIDTPLMEDDIITACDRLLTSLNVAKKNGELIYQKLLEIEKQYF